MYTENCPSCDAEIEIEESDTVLLCPGCKEPFIPGYTVLFVCSCGGRMTAQKVTVVDLTTRPTKQAEKRFYACDTCGGTIAFGEVELKTKV